MYGISLPQSRKIICPFHKERTASRLRITVMGDICRMYNSDLSTKDLARIPAIVPPSDEVWENENGKSKGYEQLELNLE